MSNAIPADAWSYYETVVVECKVPECHWEAPVSWDALEEQPPTVYAEHWRSEHGDGGAPSVPD